MAHAGQLAFFVAALVMAVQSTSATVDFDVIGGAPGGTSAVTPSSISGDGKVVVGQTFLTSGSTSTAVAFRWTEATGTVSLGDLSGGPVSANALGASYDGSVVVGFGSVARPSGSSKRQAFRWTQATGMQNISPPDPNNFGTEYRAKAVSADGTVISGGVNNSQGFRWTSTTGFNYLGIFTDAPAISADGQKIGGVSSSGELMGAAVWSVSTGWTPIPQAFGNYGMAMDLSVSGDAAAGWYILPYQNYKVAFRWTSAAGTTFLGDLPGGDVDSLATGISADGSIVVGRSATSTQSNIDITSGTEAFIWDATHGMRKLSTVLSDDFGIDMSGWVLRTANGISDDGTTITGYGDQFGVGLRAFIVTIPEPGAVMILWALWPVVLNRRGRRDHSWNHR